LLSSPEKEIKVAFWSSREIQTDQRKCSPLWVKRFALAKQTVDS